MLYCTTVQHMHEREGALSSSIVLHSCLPDAYKQRYKYKLHIKELFPWGISSSNNLNDSQWERRSLNWIIDLSWAPLYRKNVPWENGICLRLSPQHSRRAERVLSRISKWETTKINKRLHTEEKQLAHAKKINRLKEDPAFSLSLELGRREKVAWHPSADFLPLPPKESSSPTCHPHLFSRGGKDFVDTITAVKML